MLAGWAVAALLAAGPAPAPARCLNRILPGFGERFERHNPFARQRLSIPALRPVTVDPAA